MSHYHKQREAHAEAQRREDKKCAKVSMPDPMVEVDKHVVSSELQYTYLAPSGGLEHGTELITTDQAEAYAEARVWEALEEAAEIADRHNAFSTYDAILVLIPQENKS